MAKQHTIRFISWGIEVPVLWNDESLFAIDKPAGLLCVRDRWDRRRANLMDLFIEGIRAGAAWARVDGITYLANAHRLDFDTSGVFVLARSREALAKVVRQFRDRAVTKTYVALVKGALPSSPVTCSEPILPDPRRKGLAMINAKGRPSVTHLETLEAFAGFSLVRARPETGRLHQIRVHLRAIGCPVVADRDYGDGRPLMLSDLKRGYKRGGEPERPLMGRQALHADTVALDHPVTGARVEIQSPLPRDFKAALSQLRRLGPRSIAYDIP